MRGLGELTVVSGLPETVVSLFGALTHLGGPWVVLGGLAVLYAVADRLPLDRRRVGCVLAAAFVAFGTTLALKATFALPRPSGASVSGYGFPSGHALGATVVWGTAASLLDVGRRRVRLGVAGCVVSLVALSRVVIGVHYLVDVVAGCVVGLAVIGVVHAVIGGLPGSDPELGRDTTVSHAAVGRLFALGVGAALVAFALRATPEALLAVGASLGGWWGWRVVEPAVERPASSVSRRGTAVAVVGLPVVLGGLLAADTAVETGTIPGLFAGGLGGTCIALLIALPRIADRLASRE
jgi:hypothetical protein